MFPRIDFNINADKSARYRPEVSDKDDKSKMPLIPPKPFTIRSVAPKSEDDIANWYVVLSPRETRGTAGPYNVNEIRQMYKAREIQDKTLLWSEGDDDWLPLSYQTNLRAKLISLPILPPRKGAFNAELAVFDPVLELPEDLNPSNTVPLRKKEVNRSCIKCGGLAVAHMPNVGEQLPDLYRHRQEVGSTDSATEILPGFLWVGNEGSARPNNIKRLGLSLLVNCCPDVDSPAPQPPQFRCKHCPMEEHPTKPFTSEESEQLLALFEKVFDWIELERLFPELAVRADPALPPYRGKTDKYGKPVKLSRAQTSRKQVVDEIHQPPSRVLLWSHTGNGRPCVLAAAYMIKTYSIPAKRALTILKANRSSVLISKPYRAVLELWSQRYALGTLLCLDCKISTAKPVVRRQSSQLDTTGRYTGDVDDLSSTSLVEGDQQDPEYKYGSLAQLMKDHLPLLVRDSDEIALLQSVPHYLQRVRVGWSDHSPWLGLMDLELSGRGLSDLTVAVLFQLMAGLDMTRALRVVRLSHNQVNVLTVLALLKGFFPLEDQDDGNKFNAQWEPDDEKDEDYPFNQEMRVQHLRLDSELTVLDLSHNKLDEEGVHYLTYFLRQCNSLTSLDVSHNHLGDPLTSDIVEALVRPLPNFAAEPEPDFSFSLHSEASSLTGPGNKPSAGVIKSQLHSRLAQLGPEGEVSEEDDVSTHSISNRPIFNFSITELDLSYNEAGSYTAKQLRDLFRNNGVLTTLHLENCSGISPHAFRDMMASFRLYNSAIRQLNLSDSSLSVKTLDYLGRCISHKTVEVSHLRLQNCKLQHQHMAALCKHLVTAKHLCRLELSGNSFGDKGLTYLLRVVEAHCQAQSEQLSKKEVSEAKVPEACEKNKTTENGESKVEFTEKNGVMSTDTPDVRVKFDSGRKDMDRYIHDSKKSIVLPPLSRLDLSVCNLQPKGCADLLKSISRTQLQPRASLSPLRLLNLSGNHVGPRNTDFYRALAQSSIVELLLNSSQLQTAGAIQLFHGLGDISLPLSLNLRFLFVAENTITDAVAPALSSCLQNNSVLEYLDLGFNQITDACAEQFKQGTTVRSDAELERKVLSLSVNVVGNPCDPLMFEAPGMARSKNNFRYTRGNGHEPNRSLQGYGHVSERGRPQFLERKALYGQYQLQMPMRASNVIS